jgi:hypothetical protein
MVEDIITPIAGQVTTVAGMGIGLGILAGTASNVMAAQRQMMGVKQPEQRQEQRRAHVHKDWKKQKKMQHYHPKSARSPETIEHPFKRQGFYKPIKW